MGRQQHYFQMTIAKKNQITSQVSVNILYVPLLPMHQMLIMQISTMVIYHISCNLYTYLVIYIRILYTIASPTPYSTSAFFYTDTNLTLGGDFDILGRSVAIHSDVDPSIIIACAPIISAEILYAAKYPDGELLISQNSPYENSTIELLQSYPSNNPGLAILEDAFMVNSLCPATETPYNPYNIPATSTGT